MLIKFSYQNEEKVIKFLKENNIHFEELEEENYIECCPNCGNSEFWHDRQCSHCGFQC